MPTSLTDGHIMNSSNNNFNSIVNYGKNEREPSYKKLLFFSIYIVEMFFRDSGFSS